MTYPVHFRKKIIEQAKKAERIVDFLKIYGISTSTFYAWKKEIQPKKRHQKKPRTIHTEDLLNDVKCFPEATLAERTARIGTTQSAICKALRRLKISRKKTLHHPQADEQKRPRFKEELTAYSEVGYNIVYLDESRFEKQTFRTHGYAPVGEKCQATHNWQKMATRTNAIGAIREGNLFALRLFDCPIDSDIFMFG
ncbi:IS630 transposase-related protein [Avibacterium sp. 21-599]|uniref:IS630 transposase-related protein n=1 Tax=Avibacterium sp. 21-599 TaxID=2911528 RepID=UPI002245B91A|nr:IS630 transposase-related protein [Avibacterium sp. 21-599]MCW9719017.1 IS630 transposase-related protein [Avibacterium sp. 21-599]